MFFVFVVVAPAAAAAAEVEIVYRNQLTKTEAQDKSANCANFFPTRQFKKNGKRGGGKSVNTEIHSHVHLL